MAILRKRRVTLATSLCLALAALVALLFVGPPSTAAAAAPLAPPQSGILDQILQVARDARNAARNGAESAEEIRDRVRTGAEHLTGELVDSLTEVAEDLSRQISIHVEGRDVFLSGDVEGFRQQVLDLLLNMQGIMNTLGSFGEPCPAPTSDPVDLSRMIEFVEGLPDKLLFFLYQALSVSLHFDRPCGLVARIEEIQEDLAVVAQFLGETYEAGPFAFASELDSCDLMLRFPGVVRRTTFRLRASALGMKASAKLMAVFGEVGISGTAQIHGYIGGDFELDVGEKAGQLFEGLGDMLSKVESACTEKMRHCAMVGGMVEAQAEAATLGHQLTIQENQQVLLENQREIKSLLDQLLRELSTRSR